MAYTTVRGELIIPQDHDCGSDRPVTQSVLELG